MAEMVLDALGSADLDVSSRGFCEVPRNDWSHKRLVEEGYLIVGNIHPEEIDFYKERFGKQFSSVHFRRAQLHFPGCSTPNHDVLVYGKKE